MRVCIIGCGAIGLSCAVDLVRTGNDVVIYTTHNFKSDGTILQINTDNGQEYTAGGIEFKSDLSAAVAGCDYAFLTYPAFMFGSIAPELESAMSKKTVLCVFPGTGGVEFAFKNLIEKGITVTGLQRVPYTARVAEYGKVVKTGGKKGKIYLASLHKMKIDSVCSDISSALDISCLPLPNYLSVTFTPSNPILHTSRLYAMFRAYEPDEEFDRNFLFYEEWDDATSEIMLQCDHELQQICKALAPLDLTNVLPLKEYYESQTVSQMTAKISGIASFKGITSPMVKSNNGKWKIDWKSRYFTADFPYGLAIIKSFADVLDTDTPQIDEVLRWYVSSTGDKKLFDITQFGLQNKDDIINYYTK